MKSQTNNILPDTDRCPHSKTMISLAQVMLVLVIISISSQSLKSQVNIGSLKACWNNRSLADSIRYQCMKRIVTDGYMRNNPDTAMYYAKLMMDEARRNNLSNEEAQSYEVMSQVYDVKSNFAETFRCLRKADSIYLKLKNERAIAGVNVKFANSYIKLGDYSKALDYTEKSLAYHEKQNDSTGMAWDYWALARIYHQKGDFHGGRQYEMYSLALFRQLGNKEGIARLLNGIGLTYYSLSNFDSAIVFLTNSLAINEEIGNRQYISYNLNNLGRVYIEQGDFDKGLNYLMRSLKIKQELGDKWATSETLLRIGQCYLSKGEPEKAISWCQRSLALANEIHEMDWRLEALKCLYKASLSLNNLEEAVSYNEKFLALSDSINKDKTDKRLQQMEFEKKEILLQAEQEKKDALAHKELQRQKLARNVFFGGFTFVLFFAGVFFVQRNKIKLGKKRSDELLLNILPEKVAEELKVKGNAAAKLYDEATVMFTDFKDFTLISEQLSPAELVAEIDTCFKGFDTIIGKHNIEKIKTIGDSYMCAGGLPVVNKTNATDVVTAALEIQQFMKQHNENRKSQGRPVFEIRIGIHSGPVVAGIVGVKKFAYDIWGDTVNIASRMESSGEPGKVNISGSTYEQVKEKFKCKYRGKIQAKNKGETDMYFVES